MKDYIKIARVDHWIKQLFIVPGMIFAVFLTFPRAFFWLLGRLSLRLSLHPTCFSILGIRAIEKPYIAK